MILKIVLRADTQTGENQPIAERQRRKLSNGGEEKLNRSSDAAFRTIPRKNVSVFKEASRNFPF